MDVLRTSFQNVTRRANSPVLVRYPDDGRFYLAAVDVAGELGVPLGFDWLVQDVGVGVPLQRVDVNWADRKQTTHGHQRFSFFY